MTNEARNVPEEIMKNKIVQQTVNGISRFLILWIIMDKGPIHGYEIMNMLNGFFRQLIEIGSIRKSSPSRVYPMLNKMEESKLILGTWKVQDNKKIKYYQITEDGENLLYYIRDSFIKTKDLSSGMSDFIDFVLNK